MCDEILFYRLLDVKHTENKDGKPVLFLVFEYMDSDLKKYIENRRNHTKIPPNVINVNSSTNSGSLAVNKHWYEFIVLSDSGHMALFRWDYFCWQEGSGLFKFSWM